MIVPVLFVRSQKSVLTDSPFFTSPETLWNGVKLGEKESSEYMKFQQKMKKTERKMYTMEQIKIHERIEEKREAAQQHSLQ